MKNSTTRSPRTACTSHFKIGARLALRQRAPDRSQGRRPRTTNLDALNFEAASHPIISCWHEVMKLILTCPAPPCVDCSGSCAGCNVAWRVCNGALDAAPSLLLPPQHLAGSISKVRQHRWQQLLLKTKTFVGEKSFPNLRSRLTSQLEGPHIGPAAS